MSQWESALARTLLHSLWEGATVALGLALVLFCVRSSRARYAASAAAMLALVGGLVVTFTHFAPEQPVSVRTNAVAAPSAAARGGLGDGDSPHSTPGGRDNGYILWLAPLCIRMWLAGVLIFYVRGLAGWLAARRLRRTGVCCAAAAWQVRMDGLRGRLRLARPVVLLESCLAEVPVVLGYVRPVILLPVGMLSGMPVAQVEAILLHELAHIRRYDYVANLLQVYVEGLLFYHPAVWWISDVMRAERENCCDDVVVGATGGAFEYAKALAVLEARRAVPRAALAATGGGLVSRIQRLLGRPERRFASAMPLTTACTPTLCAATAMVGWQAQPVEAPRMPVVVAQVVAQAAPAPAPLPASEPDTAPAPVPAAPAAPAVILPDHPLVPNDLLSISVFDEPGLSKISRVDADGKITLPEVTEKLQAAGLLPRDIEKEISSALVDGQILLHPVVTVSILEYAERNVSVVGDVKIPGQFRITAPLTLYEALAKAGWVTADSGPDVLLTTPDSPMPRKINLQQLQMGTDPSLNVTLTGGEVINVPDAPKVWVTGFRDGPKVWITGNVAHPLVYPITNPADATVLKAIASAGGLTEHYAKTAWIYRLDDTGNRSEIHIPLSDIMHRKAPDVTLQADDVLLIPDDDSKKPQEYYDTHPLTPPWEKAK